MSFSYPDISDYARRKLMERATTLLELQQQIALHGGALNFMLAHGLHEGEQFISERHYPKGDRIDFTSGSQYFYHCHREDLQTEEHGHFHCFMRKSGWPKSWSLARIPERTLYLDNPMTHLVAIGLNRYGLPIRLFMVNRWVSKESWFAADKMQRLLKRFTLSSIENKRPKTGEQPEQWQLIDRWVEQIVHVFAPQIRWLYQQRDAQMQAHIAQAPHGENPYLDACVEELASIDISLEQQVCWLMNAAAGS